MLREQSVSPWRWQQAALGPSCGSFRVQGLWERGPFGRGNLCDRAPWRGAGQLSLRARNGVGREWAPQAARDAPVGVLVRGQAGVQLCRVDAHRSAEKGDATGPAEGPYL